MRKILIGSCAVVIVVIGALVWLGRNLDTIIQRGIERYGSEITQTDVHLAGVDFAVREGRGTFTALRIGNPEGFSGTDAIAFGEIILDVDPGSLRSEPIVIETIAIREPALHLELNESGGVNLRVLQKSVDTYTSDGADDGGDGGNRPPRVSVKTFSIESGRITLDATALGGERSERVLSSMTLDDLGGTDGIPADRLGKEVLRALLRRAIEQGAVDEIQRRAREALGKKAGDVLEGLTGD